MFAQRCRLMDFVNKANVNETKQAATYLNVYVKVYQALHERLAPEQINQYWQIQ